MTPYVSSVELLNLQAREADKTQMQEGGRSL
jgi:hypothetical protein